MAHVAAVGTKVSNTHLKISDGVSRLSTKTIQIITHVATKKLKQ